MRLNVSKHYPKNVHNFNAIFLRPEFLKFLVECKQLCKGIFYKFMLCYCSPLRQKWSYTSSSLKSGMDTAICHLVFSKLLQHLLAMKLASWHCIYPVLDWDLLLFFPPCLKHWSLPSAQIHFYKFMLQDNCCKSQRIWCFSVKGK